MSPFSAIAGIHLPYAAADAFDGDTKNTHLPHEYEKSSVAYLGTHDNDTILGWLGDLDRDTIEFCKKYIDAEKDEDIPKKLIRAALASVSDTAVIQMQDWLGLGSEARMNIPSTLGNNWKWRMSKNAATKKLAKEIAEISSVYARCERL